MQTNSDSHGNSLTNANSYSNGLTEPNRDRYAHCDCNADRNCNVYAYTHGLTNLRSAATKHGQLVGWGGQHR